MGPARAGVRPREGLSKSVIGWNEDRYEEQRTPETEIRRSVFTLARDAVAPSSILLSDVREAS
jgi:hypothetical protein